MSELPKSNHINYEVDTDIIDVWFESDELYKELRHKAFLTYEAKRSSVSSQQSLIQTIIMKSQQSYQVIAQAFMKHTAIAVAAILLTLGVIGAVGAEAVVPEEFKPSTIFRNLFSANTQQDTDPYSKLTPDEGNAVVAINECDLSIKYPRVVAQEELAVYRTNKYTPTEDYDPQIAVQSEVLIGTTVFNPTQESPVEDMIIQCFDAQTTSIEDFIDPTAYANSMEQDSNWKRTFTNDQIREGNGWFISEGDIAEYQAFYTLDSQQEYIQDLYFEYNGLLYRIISSVPSEIYVIEQAGGIDQISEEGVECEFGTPDAILEPNENGEMWRAQPSPECAEEFEKTIQSKTEEGNATNTDLDASPSEQAFDANEEASEVEELPLPVLVEGESGDTPQIDYVQGLFANQVQIQFNSLIVSEADTEIVEEEERTILDKNGQELDELPGYLTPATDSPREFGAPTGQTRSFDGLVMGLGNDGTGSSFISFSNYYGQDDQGELDEYISVRMYDELYDEVKALGLQTYYYGEYQGPFWPSQQPRIRLWGEAFQRKTPYNSLEWEMSSIDKIEVLPTTYEQEYNARISDQRNSVQVPRYQEPASVQTLSLPGPSNGTQFVYNRVRSCSGTPTASSDASLYNQYYQNNVRVSITINSKQNIYTNSSAVNDYYLVNNYINTGNDQSGNLKMTELGVFDSDCVGFEGEVLIPGVGINMTGTQAGRIFDVIQYQDVYYPTIAAGAFMRFDDNIFGTVNATSDLLYSQSEQMAIACGATSGYYGYSNNAGFDKACFENALYNNSVVQDELVRIHYHLANNIGFTY